MSPETFSDLLDRETQAPPPPPVLGTEIAAGRRRLRRRRLGTAIAAVMTVVVVSGGGLAVLSGGGPDHAQDAVATAPRADDPASLLSSCRQGNQSRAATEAMFGPGTPVVRGVVQTRFQIVAALESADGAYWGECWIHLLSAEFGSGMTVYPAQGTSRLGVGYTWGVGCGLVDSDVDPSCPTWFASVVDRLPEQVAAVRYGLGDGTQVTVPSRGGYVVLNVLRRLPTGVTHDFTEWGPRGFDPITTITYLGADGEPLAAEGPGRPPGLPGLEAYPSLRGDQLD